MMIDSAVRDALAYYRRKVTNMEKRVENIPEINTSEEWNTNLTKFWSAYDDKKLYACKAYHDDMAFIESEHRRTHENFLEVQK